MSDEYKLLDSYSKLVSEKATERVSGLSDLKQLLSNKANTKGLNDKGYHKLYEAIFRATIREKTLYIQATKLSLKKTVVTRLSACGQVFRLAVELGVKKIKAKTFRAVSKHVIDTLVVTGEGLLEPISLDYAKALRVCLQHAPHTEHIPQDEWDALATFCCESVKFQLGLLTSDENDEESSPESGISREASSASKRSLVLQPIRRLRHDSEELIQCLQLLVTATNAPVKDHSQMICNTLLAFLASQATITRVHQPVFTSLNALLDAIGTNNLTVSARVSEEIVPILVRLWDTKSPGLKDEMIICLMLCQSHIGANLREPGARSLRRKLENLFDTIFTDYIGRSEKDILQLEDIVFPSSLKPLNEARNPLALRAFSLRKTMYNQRSEQNWMIPSLIASLIEILDAPVAGDTPQDNGARIKRQKRSSHFGELMQNLRTPHVLKKICALQVVCFLAGADAVEESQFLPLLLALYDACSDDNSVVSSWAMLSISSYTLSKFASQPSHSSFWLQCWQLGSRYQSSQPTCRAACHLLQMIMSCDLVPYPEISKDIDSVIVSIDLSGPASVVDSSLSAWYLMLRKRSTMPHSTTFHHGERLFQWFVSKWRPADDGLEKTNASSYSYHSSPLEVVNFLFACSGLPTLEIDSYHHHICGPIGQAQMKTSEYSELIRFLLQQNESPDHQADSAAQLTSYGESRHPDLEDQVIDFVNKQATLIHEKWQDLISNQVQHITADVLQNFAAYLCIMSILCSILRTKELGRAAAAKSKLLDTLLPAFLSYLARDDCTQKQMDGLLRCLDDVLPKPKHILGRTEGVSFVLQDSMGDILCRISEILVKKQNILDAAEDAEEANDPMDIDEEFGMPDTDRYNEEQTKEWPREIVQSLCSEENFRTCVVSHLSLLAISMKNESNADTCSAFATHLMGFSKGRLISARPVVHEFLLASSSTMKDEDAADFTEHLALQFLQGYDTERCETSIGFCIDVITALSDRWTPSGLTADVVETCKTIYDHLVKTVLDKKVTSYTLRKSMAHLLEKMLWSSPEHRKADKMSPRSLFIAMVRDGDVRVIFHVAQHIPIMFKIFGIAAHQKVFVDIEDSLARDGSWTEGLAMRVYTLAQLARSIFSSISRMVYRIFETGQVENGQRFAARSLLMVAKALGVASQRDLFRLFSPALLYAWLESHDLRDFPFRVFDYPSLAELCNDVSEELVAQLIARGQDDVAESVASLLHITFNELVEKSFSKVIAYGVAWAVGLPPTATTTSADVRVKKRIGNETYSRLLRESYPLIIAQLFQLMQEDGASEKLFSKDVDLVEAYAVLKEIMRYGVSEGKLGDPQRPYFKVKVILNAIHHVCGRLGYEASRIWNPGMFTVVVRRLFNSIHPARGPLHACSVIRNTRLVICLAGPTAYHGYPLQMLMHGLGPYVADNICAEDATGIMRFLLVKGEAYLSQQPTFLMSSFLAMAGSLQAYFNANPNGDNEDVQTRIGVSSAKAFYTWLTNFLSNLHLSGLSPPKKRTFQAIVHSVAGLRQQDGSSRQSLEKDLLRTLLDDEQSDDPLLDEVSQRLAFTLLCFYFERPENYRNDLLGDDAESVERSRSLLRLCRRLPVNSSFLQWSARVLGRSYAATGRLYPEWTREIEFMQPSDFDPKDQGIDIIPKVGILRKIKSLLLSQEKEVVALTESTLTCIMHDENTATTEGEDDRITPFVFDDEQYKALRWNVLPFAPHTEHSAQLATVAGSPSESPSSVWICSLATVITTKLDSEPLVKNLRPLLQKVDGLAEELFSYMLHLLLIGHQEDPSRALREEFSEIFRDCFKNCNEQTAQHNIILIKSILYLRTQEVLNEKTQLARDWWLDINYLDLSRAACVCKMYKSSLLFAEIYKSEHSDETIYSDLLLEIFRNVDDPDSYYGVGQTSNLETVLKQFEYEGDGWKSLSFRGANLESDIHLGSRSEEEDTGVIDALNTLGMNGLSHSFLKSGTVSTASDSVLDNMFRSAWKLEQWDLPCPASCTTRSATIYRALQAVNTTVDSRTIPAHLDTPLLDLMQEISAAKQTGHSLGEGMRTLALMTEMEEVLVSSDASQLEDVWNRFQSRASWMHIGRYSDVEEIMAMRQATFGSLAKRKHLQESCRVDTKAARFLEAKALVSSCKMARSHGNLQHALSAATQLSKVVQPCLDVGLDINSVATLQAANVLWQHGQGATSIRMLQGLEGDADDSSQSMIVGRAKLLAKLGNWISEARLERADKIMSNYLEKAIVELRGKNKGSEAGRVFHEFAYFCDQQLQNPGNIEDYQRALKLRQNKDAEVREFEKLMKANPNSKDNNQLSVHRNRARTWLKLDDAEFNRLKESREAFLEKSVSNYLRCLSACDDYAGDAVRFCALWLANSGDHKVNNAALGLENVPSRKFVPLMNQLSSRLLESPDDFQSLLFSLIVRICTDHPHHGIYQILALYRLLPKDKDYMANLRKSAATRITEVLKSSSKVKEVFTAIRATTNTYIKLAKHKIEKKGNKPLIMKAALPRDLYSSIERDIPSYKIPPPTMHIDIRADCDYRSLPVLVKFDEKITLASGLSAPKIVKCFASDGKEFKLLVKGGNDDLRQDSIMEQVFEQVSMLLQKSRATRQRDLRIRTYKVLPLTTSSGVIEFVPNTIPLHDYLIPAHAHYHPKEWKNAACRKAIQDVQGKDRDARVAAFQNVMEHFTPVLRYFFMHKFDGPDEWFASRLAYTRSTAAISILGHVLGLGDRHGHNILLDNKSGEVVHIDLGVAFEQGRILPVPEVVPFRLTRDIVDGMGITKTEGVFRRCCEFTLEVLRNESYNIVTILDVLRYDPLYSWTISPLRMRKMQENHFEAPQPSGSTPSLDGIGPSKPKDESESEADRALTVVAKKLSKTLSVGATVNELIQQASDERNLAVLYSGWAAFV